MQEAFLHFVWKYQYFDKSDLSTVNGQKLNIIKSGFPNTNAGPDFEEGHVVIDDLDWRGSIEMHTKSSYWYHHKHESDPIYENVVLHVVWEHDKEVVRKDGTNIPVLALQGLVKPSLMRQYKKLTLSPDTIACHPQLTTIKRLTFISTLERAVSERLSRKADEVKNILDQNTGDWEETLYQVMAKNFGFKVNAEPFTTLSQTLPYKVLRKQGQSIKQIEALMFGQAGYLEEDTVDDYHKKLQKEYEFLYQKYNLIRRLDVPQWKMMRLRPANFPVVRIAQFAAVISQKESLFSMILNCANIKDLMKYLEAEPSEYWQHHYHFNKSADKKNNLGSTSLENIIINSIAPILAAYAIHQDDQTYFDRAISFLQSVRPENNKITRLWSSCPVPISSGFDSQGLIELTNSYCSRKKCLNCAVGTEIIKKG